jgi:hypothetical protein
MNLVSRHLASMMKPEPGWRDEVAQASKDSRPVQRTLDVVEEMQTLLIPRKAGKGLRRHIGQAPPHSGISPPSGGSQAGR